MAASLAWIDFDAKAHQRSQRILALFRERDTVDELGVGVVRDALADILFPGVSTIQTRLGYMLYVPWMYVELERRGVGSARIAQAARDSELKLSAALLAGADEHETGIFGRHSGRGLQRLPSEVYWAGLAAWGIRLYPGSPYQYHQAVDGILARRRHRRQGRSLLREAGEDAGVLAEPELRTWHPGLPTAPEGFPEGADLRLRPEDLAYLRERIRHSQPGSLLAWLVARPEVLEVAWPWEHPRLGAMHPEHRGLLAHARHFSLLLQGASLLYNLMLAEEIGQEAWREGHRERLDAWGEEVAVEGEALRSWAGDLFALWRDLLAHDRAIADSTRDFVTRWRDVALPLGAGVAGSPEARDLVRAREQMKKKASSRFSNPSVRAQWGGASGIGRFDYRWTTVQRFLADFAAG